MKYISKLKFIVIPAVVLGALLVILPAKSSLAFNLFGGTCNGSSVQGGTNDKSAVCTDSTKNPDAKDNVAVNTIRTAANIIASITGVAAVIMVIVGGFTYVTAGGNTEQTATARRRITSALIGAAIVALAWTITRFITDNVIG
jgi:cytochrome bd-type quinol oxidase subunit 2